MHTRTSWPRRSRTIYGQRWSRWRTFSATCKLGFLTRPRLSYPPERRSIGHDGEEAAVAAERGIQKIGLGGLIAAVIAIGLGIWSWTELTTDVTALVRDAQTELIEIRRYQTDKLEGRLKTLETKLSSLETSTKALNLVKKDLADLKTEIKETGTSALVERIEAMEKILSRIIIQLQREPKGNRPGRSPQKR